MLLIARLTKHIRENDGSLLLGRVDHSVGRSYTSLSKRRQLEIPMSDSMIPTKIVLIRLE